MSWVHAIISGIWCIYCLWSYEELRLNPLLFTNPIAYNLMCFSTGYFVYDFIDMILNKQALKLWEVSLHHVGVIAVFYSSLMMSKAIGYGVYALLTEINSIFLHLRKLLQMMRVDARNVLYRFNNVVNVISCALFRGGALVIITHGMVMLPIREECGTVYVTILTIAMVVMFFINPTLLWRLVKNDFLRPYKVEKVDKANNNM